MSGSMSMNILWFLLAGLSCLVLALLLAPLLRRKTDGTRRADFDIEVYLDQLRELERDAARGIIGPAETTAARTEIERRLLAADRSRDSAGPAPAGRRHITAAVALLVAVPAAALALYLQIGSPHLPGAPFAERQSTPQDSLIAQVGARLAEAEAATRATPGNASAWFDLGRLRFLARRWSLAAEAFAEAARLAPERGDYAAAWGEALVYAADGTVTETAQAVFGEAMMRDPGEPRARFYLALAEQQAGRPDDALQRLLALLRDSPADAPWRAPVEARIRALATELGADADTLLAGIAPRGPDAADVAAAQQMAPAERSAMIRSMVDGLAARLAEAPDDVAGWRQLGRSWGVLGEPAKASAAYGRALALEPNHAETLFQGAMAAMDADEHTAALDRFSRLKTLIPPENPAFGAVERAIRELQAGSVK